MVVEQSGVNAWKQSLSALRLDLMEWPRKIGMAGVVVAVGRAGNLDLVAVNEGVVSGFEAGDHLWVGWC